MALLGGLLTAAVSACGSETGSSPTPPPTPPPAPAQEVFYTAIGASDAVGVGGSVLCVPLAPCPNGTGYVAVIARRLATGRAVTLTNLGIPAAVLSARIQALGQQYGRSIPGNFIQHSLNGVPSSTTVVTVFAGGNDVNAIGTAIDRGAAGSDVAGYIASQVRQFGDELAMLIAGIRTRAPGARIVIANLPNLGALPYAQGFSAPQRGILTELSVGFSRQAINPLAAQGVPVVDTLCDPRWYDPSFYSSDGFHPNDAGYAYLADGLFNAITMTNYPAPPGCAVGTLVSW
jgi:lysophospholipase L1-like esterase